MTKPIADGSHCGAKKRQGEGHCSMPAGWGTDHAGRGPCKLHGGSAPQVARSAELQLAEFQAFREISLRDAPPITDPLTALAELAGQVSVWRDLLAAKVEELTSYGYENYKAGEQLHTDVALFERAMDRCLNTLAAIARLRIDERLAKIEQKKVDLVADALAATLAELGIDQAVQHQAADGLERRLRLVAG
jgi:hypothetical protein